jgi:sigma-B regulation protein RsbU (phosphoserine phosphatase)
MRTLVADDQPDVVEALRLLLKGEGIQIEAAHSPATVLEKVSARAQDYDVLLMDLNYARDTTSGQEGLDLLARLRELDRTLPVVVMTAWGSVPLAVETLRRGARDFVLKPWENGELLAKLRAEAERGQEIRRAIWLQKKEWEQAREVERGLLPEELPQVPGFELAANWQPACQVGGDFFDVRPLGEGRFALCVADSMGKGVAAALVMSNLQAAVCALEPCEPAELCRRVNSLLCRNLRDGRFATFFYGVLDTTSRELRYASAGHCPPLVGRAAGGVERLAEGGVVLGLLPDAIYGQGTVALASGDRLVLYTDGLTEAEDPAGEQLGEARLTELVAEHRSLTVAALCERLCAAAGRPQDDLTLLIAAAL